VNDTPSSNTLDLGLIGAGPWGRNIIRTIAGLDGVRLARLASRNPESAGLVPADCIISEDWQGLIDAGDLNGVIIATPPTTHAEMTIAAIKADLAVMVEKPMTLSLNEADAVLAAAAATGAIVLVDHIHLYSAAWEALTREAQALGSLNAVSAVAGNWGPFRPDTPMLWDWGAHDIAMCLDLIGKTPKTVIAQRIETRTLDGGRGETLALELGFGDVTAKIALSTLSSEKTRLFTASLDGGELVYNDAIDEKLHLKISPQDLGKTLALSQGTPLERAIHAFCAAIRLDAADIKGAVLGRDVVKVLTQLQQHLA